MSDETLRELERRAVEAPDDVAASAALERAQARGGLPLDSPHRPLVLAALRAALVAELRRRVPLVALRVDVVTPARRLYRRPILESGFRARLHSTPGSPHRLRGTPIGPPDPTLTGRSSLRDATHILTDLALDPDTGDLRIAVEPVSPEMYGRTLETMRHTRAPFRFAFAARGNGSVIRREDGVDVVGEDFILTGIDVVAEPLRPRDPLTLRAGIARMADGRVVVLPSLREGELEPEVPDER